MPYLKWNVMYKIVYNIETKTFGIHADRVREVALKHARKKYGRDSEKVKNLNDKRVTYDYEYEVEPGTYGYTPTPMRVFDIEQENIKKGRSGEGYGRLNKHYKASKYGDKNYESGIPNQLRNAINKTKSTMREDLDDLSGSEYQNKELADKIVKDQSKNLKFHILTDADHKPTKFQKSLLDTFKYETLGSPNSGAMRLNDVGYLLFDDAHRNNPAVVAHELGHLTQGKDDDAELDSDDMYRSANGILNYIAHRNQREHDANNKAMKSVYRNGGNDTDMTESKKVTDSSNASYDLPLLQYTPLNLDKNMDKETEHNMIQNIYNNLFRKK